MYLNYSVTKGRLVRVAATIKINSKLSPRGTGVARFRCVFKLNFWRCTTRCLFAADVNRVRGKTTRCTRVIERYASLRFGNRLIDGERYDKLKKNARRQYVRIILRNLFINNHILSHAIQEFLLLFTVSFMAFSLSCSVNNTHHPAEEDPPTTRNRFPRNGFDIYSPRILRLGKETLYINKRRMVNKGVHRISVLRLTHVYACPSSSYFVHNTTTTR